MIALALAAAVACGPPHARTLAHDVQARVYVRDRVAYGCSGRHTTRLGAARAVKLAGHFVLVRRGTGEIRVYDLRRRGRPERTVVDGRITALALNDSGFAAYISRSGDGALGIGALAEAELVEPVASATFLRLGGDALAYSTPFGVTLLSPEGDSGGAAGTLLRSGSFRLEAEHSNVLVLHGAGWTRTLGWAMTECESSSGCAGIDMVQRAGGFFAVHETDVGRDDTTTSLVVYDRDGHPASRCGSQVVRFVLAPDGAVACSLYGPSIVSQGVVLDSGPGLDVDSLLRRGDQLVWRHDGAERTWPLTASG